MLPIDYLLGLAYFLVGFSSPMLTAPSLQSAAIEFTKLTFKLNPTTNICDTWIFPIENEIQNGERNCVSLNQNLHQPSIFVDIKFRTNFSYANEFTIEDVLNPTQLGIKRFGLNCASVFIPATQKSFVEILISLKFGQPHKDFFIFIGSINSIHHLFAQNQKIRELRYKYGFDPKLFHTYQNTCAKDQFATNGESNLRPYDRKCDSHLNGKQLRVVSSGIKPFVNFIPDDGNSGNLEIPVGTQTYILKELSFRLNFTFELRYANPGGASGRKIGNKWDGAVGEILYRDADLAISIAPTVFRTIAWDTTVITDIISRHFFIRTPSYSNSWTAIINPLSSTVWVATFCATLFLAAPGFYACIVLSSQLESSRSINSFRLIGTILESLYQILVCQSPSAYNEWKSVRLRSLLLLWSLFALLIGTAYNSKLITVLTFTAQNPIPTTHAELTETEYKLYFRYMGGVAITFTQSSPLPHHRQILKTAILVNTSEAGLFSALFSPKPAAWLDYNVNAEFALQQYATLDARLETNPLFVMSTEIDHQALCVWGVRKGSPFLETFDSALLNFLAGGLYNHGVGVEGHNTRVRGVRRLRTETKYANVRRQMEAILESLIQGPMPLNNRAFLGLYGTFGIGIFVNCIIFLGEILIAKKISVKIVARNEVILYEVKTSANTFKVNT